MKVKFSPLLFTSRPISWLNTAFPFAAGYLAAGGRIDAIWIVGTLYFLIPYNLLMYGINDIFDYESDIKNPRKGGIEGAVTDRARHPLILRAIIVTNLPFLAALLWLGTPLSNFLLVGIVAAVIYYSAPPRFKERPVLDSVTSSLHFAGPLLYALTFHGFSQAGMIATLAFLLWGIASHAFGAVQDILPDRAAGIRSIATAWGARRATRFSALLYLITSGLLCLQGRLFAIAGIALLAYTINVWPHRSVTDETSADTHRAWRRFIWLNYVVGCIVTILLIISALT